MSEHKHSTNAASSPTPVTGGKTVDYANGGNYAINGGTLEIDAPANAKNQTWTANATAGSAGGKVYVTIPNTAGSATQYTLNITNPVPAGFQIEFDNIRTQQPAITRTITEWYDSSAQTTTFRVAFAQSAGNNSFIQIIVPGNPYGLKAGSASSPSRSTTIAQGKQYTEQIPCYLAGTMIATPEGRVAVETLVEGDVVTTHNDGITSSSRVIWAGYKTVAATSQDELPVRIAAGALADGVPYKDLLVTPEHCLLVDGRFVPARMLVNGRSITIDTSAQSFTVYHIETETHSVLDADGALAESYLDTGNRRTFRSEGSVVYAFRPVRDWNQDAAAPLDTTRGFVEPIHARLVARAEALGLADTSAERVLTDDADLQVTTLDGRVLRMMRGNADRASFVLPTGVTEVVIHSRASRPSDVFGPFVDDRRALGVLVGAVTLFDSGETRAIDTHLTAETLSGWNNREAGACRWTAGAAHLSLGHRDATAFGVLAIEIKAAGPYVVTATDAAEAALSA